MQFPLANSPWEEAVGGHDIKCGGGAGEADSRLHKISSRCLHKISCSDD